MDSRAKRISRVLDQAAGILLFGAVACLAFSYHITSEILSAFALGVFFACLCAGVLIFSYALFVRAQVTDDDGG